MLFVHRIDIARSLSLAVHTHTHIRDALRYIHMQTYTMVSRSFSIPTFIHLHYRIFFLFTSFYDVCCKNGVYVCCVYIHSTAQIIMHPDEQNQEDEGKKTITLWRRIQSYSYRCTSTNDAPYPFLCLMLFYVSFVVRFHSVRVRHSISLTFLHKQTNTLCRTFIEFHSIGWSLISIPFTCVHIQNVLYMLYLHFAHTHTCSEWTSSAVKMKREPNALLLHIENSTNGDRQ